MTNDALPHAPRTTARRAGGRADSNLPTLLTIEAVADYLGVGVRHVRRLVAERRIPYLKWGHLLRFDPTEIAEWLDAKRVEPAADRSRS